MTVAEWIEQESSTYAEIITQEKRKPFPLTPEYLSAFDKLQWLFNLEATLPDIILLAEIQEKN